MVFRVRKEKEEKEHIVTLNSYDSLESFKAHIQSFYNEKLEFSSLIIEKIVPGEKNKWYSFIENYDDLIKYYWNTKSFLFKNSIPENALSIWINKTNKCLKDSYEEILDDFNRDYIGDLTYIHNFALSKGISLYDLNYMNIRIEIIEGFIFKKEVKK